MPTKPYDREKSLAYTNKWALSNNPDYYNFSSLGGDCTNFASQVIYAGSGVMNYTPVYGWYYNNANDKSPAWSGVNYLYNFLVNNKETGPYAEETGVKEMEVGDIIQLSFVGNNNFQHSLVVTKINHPINFENINISTHSPHAYNEKLTNYSWAQIRFIHIKGVNV